MKRLWCGQIVLAAVVALVVLMVPVLAQRSTQPESDLVGTIEHVWKPVGGGGPEVTAIEVRTEVKELPASAAESFSLDAPITYAGVPGIAERVQNLEVKDASGPVAFRIEDDEPHPGGFHTIVTGEPNGR